MRFRGYFAGLLLANATLLAAGQGAADDRSAEVRIGQRLFFERGFSECFAEADGRSAVASRATDAMSCARCHNPPGTEAPGEAPLGFCDREARSGVPARGDGRPTTPRNSPSLLGSLGAPAESTLLHYDGEFASAEALVAETFLGRNFGWLPRERSAALRHFATVIRTDRGDMDAKGDPTDAARFSYAVLLAGTSPALPAPLRLPPEARLDVARASDEQLLAACSRLVTAYVRSLQFSRDADGFYDGSSYDAFLVANRLPRGPRRGETAREYTQRLAEALGALRSPVWVKNAVGGAEHPFGEVELRGMRVFFKAAVGEKQKSGAGNCAECHTAPEFTDLRFHNTGSSQDEYDSAHGAGTFLALRVPSLAERERDFDRWLPATPAHPNALGSMRAACVAGDPDRADLGAWNIYGNPDFPFAQPALRGAFNRGGRNPDEALGAALAAFKTPTVRNLAASAPYLHTGRATDLAEVVRFYERVSALSHAGKLRNAPPEFFTMRLADEDVEPLVRFLAALNERSYLARPGRPPLP